MKRMLINATQEEELRGGRRVWAPNYLKDIENKGQ